MEQTDCHACKDSLIEGSKSDLRFIQKLGIHHEMRFTHELEQNLIYRSRESKSKLLLLPSESQLSVFIL